MADAVWRLAPGQRLAHRGWDGEHVVYNDLSGDTHLLDERALQLLLALRAGARTHAELAPLAGAGELEALLGQLEALALVECCA